MPAASRSSPAPAKAILGAGAILLACTLEARAQAPQPAAPPAARDAAAPAPPQTPPASPAAAAPAILDELESIQLVTDDWNFQPVATDSPLPENPSAGLGRRAKEPDYSFAGMTPPAFSQGDLAARAVEEMLRESAPPSFDPYPRAVRTPDYNDPLPAWILGTPMSLAAIAPFSAERRALGSLNAPNWLRANRSLRVGTARVRYAIEADAQGAFATNVLGTSDNPQNDFLFTLQPAFYAEMGTKNQVRFLYMPTLVRYQKFRQFDAFNQSFLFGSRFRAAKLQLGLDVSYITQSGLFLSSAGQARQKSLIARFTANYPITRKTALSVVAEAGRIDSSPGGIQNQASFTAHVDYTYSPKTRFGTGVTVGVIESPEGTTTYQTFLVRLLYTPSAKLSINAEGGLQFRQSRGPFGTSATVSTAVISALLNYRPTAKTTVTMRLFRDVDVDAFTPGNLQTLTGIEGNISWKISPRAIFDANLLGGYAEYDTLSGQGAGSYLFTQGTLSLSYLFFDDVNVRVFTSMQQRLRDTQGNSYTSTLSGASLGMRF